MSDDAGDFIPALRFKALTRHFDTVVARTLKEERFRGLLLDQAGIEPGHRVVDIGCGTGTLAVMLKRRVPEAEVIALDPDSDALAIARKKAADAGVDVDFKQTLAWAADIEDGSVDRVLSSLVLHHLTTPNKRRSLERARKWLRPGGELHIADWGKAQNWLMRAAFLGVQLLDGFETTRENVRVGLVPCIQEAGLGGVEETHREQTLFGTLSLYRGSLRP